MPAIARVRIPSPLPQLDKDFDYLIPANIYIEAGYVVKVPFGRGTKTVEAVVVEIADESAFAGKLASIAEICADMALVSKQQIQLVQAISDRYPSSAGEIFAQVVPRISKRVNKTYVQSKSTDTKSNSHAPYKVYQQLQVDRNFRKLVLQCIEALERGESSLVVLPDFRDLEEFERVLSVEGIQDRAIRHSSTDAVGIRYRSVLRSLDEVGINYGTRGACFSASLNLGLIILVDDLDESHIEPTYPYWNSREVLLMRQELENCSLVFASTSPSSDVLRLIEIGYLKCEKAQTSKRLVRTTKNQSRLDEETFGLISKALKDGKSVLIQVANLGYASALACRNCKEIRTCSDCGSRVWIDAAGITRCRNCKSNQAGSTCKCGSNLVQPIRTGASAIASWLEKAFPKSVVIRSTGAERISAVEGSGHIVIATPGAEPSITGGYSVVVIADAVNMLGVPKMRAVEWACLSWANAISKTSSDGLVVFVGVGESLGTYLNQLDFYSVVESDYLERKELQLPPFSRLGSALAQDAKALNTLVEVLKNTAPTLRLLPGNANNSIGFNYQYSDSRELAQLIKSALKSIHPNSKGSSNIRPIKVRMDDFNII